MKNGALAFLAAVAISIAMGAARAGEAEVNMLELTGIGGELKYPREPDYFFRDRPHDTPFSGIARKWYRNEEGGRLECEVVVKDGYAVSRIKYYDEMEPAVESEQTLDMAISRRFDRTYHRNGELRSEESYIVEMGKSGVFRDGLFKIYHENGTLSAEEHYANGKKDGMVKVYSKDGVLLEEAAYKEGKRNGPLKEYHKNGKLKKETVYAGDKEDGVRTDYRDDGTLQQTQEFKAGKADGVQKKFRKDGSMSQSKEFRNGRPDGAEITYANDGKTVTKTIMYKNGNQVKDK